MTEPRQSIFERHAQTIVSALLIGLISWVGVSVNGLGQQMVRVEEQLRISQSMSAARDIRIQRHEDALRDLQIRVDRLERPQ